MPWEPSFTRYLAAKKSIDDRALNRNVWDTLVAALPPASASSPLRVVEVGAGIGTMLERLVARGVLTHAAYTAIDADPANIAELNRRLLERGPQNGLSVTPLSSDDTRTRLASATHDIVVESVASDVFDWIAQAQDRASSYDLILAHAFLDLLDIPHALPQLFSLLRRGGLFYFTINFDGATLFEPELDSAFDAEIERLYHRTMDERITNGAPSGDSRAGRHLFHLLRQAGAEILAAGSSDWVVFGGAQGYPGDEAYFLHFIVDTLCHALETHPGLAGRQDRFHDWIARRHQQIEDGTLVYIAHQLDFVGRYN